MLAVVAGIALFVLILEMILKYGLDQKNFLTEYWSPIHGLIYFAYACSIVNLGFKSRWPLTRIVLNLLSGFVPFRAVRRGAAGDPLDRGAHRRARGGGTRAASRLGGVSEDLQAQPVLVVDYGAQYAQLIARRVREAKVYSEVVPHTTPVAELLAKQPRAVILSGGPSSVYAEGAPELDKALLEAGVPVMGLCYGFQAMVQALGGSVAHTAAASTAPRRRPSPTPARPCSTGRRSTSRCGCRTATR